MDYLVTSQIIVENDVDEFNGMVLDYPDYESFSEETSIGQQVPYLIVMMSSVDGIF